MSNTNTTTEVFVPLLKEGHQTFTLLADQPQIPAELANPFTKTWEGYFKLESDGNVTITVGADDNACVTLLAFPQQPVDLQAEPGDPNGGGKYREIEGVFTNLSKGYYRVRVTYENVRGPAENLSQLVVKVNNAIMQLGELSNVKNLMTQSHAEALYNAYLPVSYSHTDENGNQVGKTAENVWQYVGGNLYQEHLRDTTDDYQDTCALRLSIALGVFGVPIASIGGNVTYRLYDHNNVTGETVRVILGAEDMDSELTKFFGIKSFSSWDLYAASPGKSDSDILLRSGPGHVGLCKGRNKNSSGLAGETYENDKYWLLWRASFDEPSPSEYTLTPDSSIPKS